MQEASGTDFTDPNGSAPLTSSIDPAIIPAGIFSRFPARIRYQSAARFRRRLFGPSGQGASLWVLRVVSQGVSAVRGIASPVYAI